MSDTPRTDAWCELAMNADVSAVLELAKEFERELSAVLKILEDGPTVCTCGGKRIDRHEPNCWHFRRDEAIKSKQV